MAEKRNKWVETARWVSIVGKKETLRDDPFAHAATFTIKDGGYDYKVSAHSSPYSTHGQSFVLTVKRGSKVVCKYSFPGDTAEVSLGEGWLRKE